MKIVIYKAQGKDWQMIRAGDKKAPFYTTSRKPERMADGRSARGFARSCQTFARKKLGWEDAVFTPIDEHEFKALKSASQALGDSS